MNTVTIRASDLHELLAPVALAASTDKQLPSICTVLLRRRGADVQALATNRFVAAISQQHLVEPDDSDDWEILISSEDVKTIVTAFKLRPGTVSASDHVTFTLQDDGKLAVGLGQNVSHLLSPIEADFPRIDGVIQAAIAEVIPCGAYQLDPKWLTLVGKAASLTKNARVKLRLGATAKKPAVVTIGDALLLVVMPAGPSETVHLPELEDWARRVAA